MRGRGINYDTGFWDGSRPAFDRDVVRRELKVIADDLHCNVVRVSGDDPERLSVAGEAAVDAGLELWFAPFPSDLEPDALLAFVADCAERAERLRERSPDVVFVVGCELTLFNRGFMPGDDKHDRLNRAMTSGELSGPPGHGYDAEKFTSFMAEAVRVARERFGGRLSYASGKWEVVDWDLFDFVAVDAYRDAKNQDRFVDHLKDYFKHGKPVVMTEFGCCTFTGAGEQGGTGWTVCDTAADPPYVREGHVRDEDEPVRYMLELLDIFEELGADSAFWFTFAGYSLPYRDDPRFDLDMGAYGVVKVFDDGRLGTAYPDMRWEPKAAFGAMAERYAAMARDAA